MGRRRLGEELPRPDRGRLVGPPAPARGRRANVRRARREHRQLRRRRRGPAREEPLHGRGRRPEEPALAPDVAAQPRGRVRRVPRHSELSIDPVAAAGFGAAANLYERARPSYPQAAVDWLIAECGIAPASTVVDLGAGTGKLTRLLVPSGARVVAVEPIAEMRAHIEGAEVLDGTAEEVPLPDRSADVVTVAQAFHWFDHDRALPEIHRALREGGRLVLVWNMRDLEDPLQGAVEDLLRPIRSEVRAQALGAWRVPLERSSLFGQAVVGR